MKKLMIFLLGLAAIPALCQTAPKFDGPSWQPPYKLELDGWGIERFLIPIDFAPQIPYKGIEDIRFTTGWGDIHSKEYWTYSFLWYLDGLPKIDADSIAEHLNYYYDGLISRNIEKRNIPEKMVTKTKTQLKQVKAAPGDLRTFEGTIAMLDYMAKKPMVLHCSVHLKRDKHMDKTILFHQVSPRPFQDELWEKLRKLWTDFKYPS